MSQKKSLEEQVSKLALAGSSWIEPMRQWIKQAVSLCETAKKGEPNAIKDAFTKIEGLNLILKSKKAQPTAALETSPPYKNQWVALRASLHIFKNNPKSCDMVCLYNEARTYFMTK
jgi:hypothetical protein